jgi:4-amino-4-deoxy-L-arabinose transferase-like glycosyltransferase
MANHPPYATIGDSTARNLLAALILFFVALGITYGLMTPVFENPDESSHLSLIHYLSLYKTLPPPVRPEHPFASGAEIAEALRYHEPPLYYAPPLYHALGALLTFWTPMDDLPHLLVPNPSWEAGYGLTAGNDPENKNFYAHRWAEETPAHSGTVRAAYTLRLFSLGLGTATLVCIYKLARGLFPDRHWLGLGATAFIALTPQFIALSASVTNDNLLIALFAIFFVVSLRAMREGAPSHRWALLGGIVGLSLLTKQSALLLFPLGLLAILWQNQDGHWRLGKVITDGAVFVAVALMVGGWWYVRNAILFNDPLGFAPHFTAQVPLESFTWNDALAILRTYSATFGWTQLSVEPAYYTAVGGVFLAALAGLITASLPGGMLAQSPAATRRGMTILSLCLAMNVVSLVRWAVATGAPYGRLLFPSLPAIGLLAAAGLAQWGRWRAGRWVLAVLAVLALIFAALIPWRILRPAFGTPRLAAGLPRSAQTVEVAYQNGLHLIGFEGMPAELYAGQPIELTLYWHTDHDLDRRYRAAVQLGPESPYLWITGADTWLGGTLYPSELWRAGDTVRQTYRFTIPDLVENPGLYWIRVAVVDDREGRTIPLADGSGDMAVLGPWVLYANNREGE